jgi:hypothetical protein
MIAGKIQILYKKPYWIIKIPVTFKFASNIRLKKTVQSGFALENIILPAVCTNVVRDIKTMYICKANSPDRNYEAY